MSINTESPKGINQHADGEAFKEVRVRLNYDPEEYVGKEEGILEAMSFYRDELNDALTNRIFKAIGRGGILIKNYVCALTTIDVQVQAKIPETFRFGQKPKNIYDSNTNGFIPNENVSQENTPEGTYARESEHPYEFFTEGYITPEFKFDTLLLREALENKINVSRYENRGKVKFTFTIKIFEFETTVKKFGDISLVFVNKAFNTIGPKSSGGREKFGKYAYKLVEQFLNDAPEQATSPILTYIFNAGVGDYFIPDDPMSAFSTEMPAFAGFGDISRFNAIPSKSYFTNAYGTDTYNLSVDSAGSHFDKFTPEFVEKLAPNSITGRNALMAAYNTAKRLARNRGQDMTSLSPGGIGSISLFRIGANYALLHEVLHSVLYFHSRSFLTANINISKILSNPLEEYFTVQKLEEVDALFGYWSSIPGLGVPCFNNGHPRPLKQIKPNDHKLGLTSFLMFGAKDETVGLITLDISHAISYADHPFSTQFLAYAEMKLLTGGFQGALNYIINNRPDHVYDFYMFAAAVLLNKTANKFSYVADPRDIIHFISKIKTYNDNFKEIKKTKSYAFLDLLNKGVDDLHTSFNCDLTVKQMAEKFDAFKAARKKEYELTYEDFKEGNPGLIAFIRPDGDFLKLNNSMTDESDTRQDDARERINSNSVGIYSHLDPLLLRVLGFKAYEEVVDGKRVGKIIEVHNGEPIKERAEGELVEGTVKKHRLIISYANSSQLSGLESEHRRLSTATYTARQEKDVIESVYGSVMVTKSLAFPKEDGSGDEEMKYVYVLVSDKNGNGKTNLNVGKKTITDDIGVSIDIE